MDAVKIMAYAAVSYSIGREIMDFGTAVLDPDPSNAFHFDTWKSVFEGIRSAPTLAIGVHLIALAYLGQDLINSQRPSKLRSEKLEVFGTPAMKSVALGTVATLVGIPIATTALTVGPFYAPLVTDGLDAFVRSLPKSGEAFDTLAADLESPFNLQTIAVFAAYRYMRHEMIPSALRGWMSSFRSARAAVYEDTTSGSQLSLRNGESLIQDANVAGQSSNKTPNFRRSPSR